MARGKILEADVKKKIIELKQEGKKSKDIAYRFGTTYHTVQQVWRNYERAKKSTNASK